MPVFKTGAINHSATSPVTTVLLHWSKLRAIQPSFCLYFQSVSHHTLSVERFSRPPVSTAHTSLRGGDWLCSILRYRCGFAGAAAEDEFTTKARRTRRRQRQKGIGSMSGSSDLIGRCILFV